MNPFQQNRFLRFLGSVRMAVPMLLVLAVLLAIGTFVESKYSTFVAKRFVYGTWWFGGFLLLLAVNLFCSALSRFPWKKHQTGFVITHLGIILILAGSLVTQRFGSDGQIALKEGEAGNVFQEDRATFYWQEGGNPIHEMPAVFQLRAPSPENPRMIQLEEGGLLILDRYHLHAQKSVRARAAEPEEKGALALRLILESSFVKEDQWLLLEDAERGRIDLGPASILLVRKEDWRGGRGRAAQSLGENALILTAGKDGSLAYQVKRRGKLADAEVLEAGKEYVTGWMDMKFKVSQMIPAAVMEETFFPVPLPYQKDPEPALHYQVVDHPERKEGWLGFHSQEKFTLGGKDYALAFGPRQKGLPFRLELVKFHIGFDPGTRKAASYASDVKYMDMEKGREDAAVISMNEPLHLAGYTVYQASYQALEEGGYISVFSVGNDPGITLKYAGALVMVLGIAFMFWFKNPAWNKRDTQDEKKY